MGSGLCPLPCSPAAASAPTLQGWSSSGKPVLCSQTSSLGWGCSQPPGETNHKRRRKLSTALGKFQVCRQETSLAEAARSSCVPGSRCGWVTGGRENRRKYQQKKEGWGVTHRTGLRLRRGFTERVSWPDPAGWHQVPRPRRGRGLDGCCSLTSICAGTSPRCHNYSKVLVSVGGRAASPGLTGGRGCRQRAGAVRVAPSLVCLQAN